MNGRALLVILVLVGLGAAGYWKRDQLSEYGRRWFPAPGERPAPGSAPDVGGTTAPGGAARPPGFTGSAPAPLPPGTQRKAPPGTLFITKKKRMASANGVQVLYPGEQVKILQRLGGGKVRVTIDDQDFTLEPSEVTDDLEVVRQAQQQAANSQ